MPDNGGPGSETVTDGIRVRVTVRFVAEQSQLEADAPLHFVHAYTVTVTNESRQPATLVARHWLITDANGREENVRGPGVVGLQPSLQEGQSFTYTSSVALPTSAGTMQGTYLMEWDDGTRFPATVAPFALVFPDAVQ